jgi:hypothetical protein
MNRDFELWWLEHYPDMVEGKELAHEIWLAAWNRGHSEGWSEGYSDGSMEEDY